MSFFRILFLSILIILFLITKVLGKNNDECSVGFSEHPILKKHTYKLDKKNSEASENIKLNNKTELFLTYGGCAHAFIELKFVIHDKEAIAKISTGSDIREHYLLVLELINLVQKKQNDIYHLSDMKDEFKTYIRLTKNVKLNEELTLKNEGFPNILTLDTHIINKKLANVTVRLSVDI